MTTKKCLITGGAGFVGSHLAEKMIEKGWKLIIIDNLSTGKLENLKKIIKQVKFVHADIRDFAKLQKENLHADVIVHLAAKISVVNSVINPKKTFDVNVGGTVNILELARKIEVKKIVFASSSAVYGNINKENISESEVLKPISPYGLSKLMAEELLAFYNRTYGVTTTSLRFFNMYGPRQNGNSPYSGVISIFLSNIKKNRNSIIYGSGNQTRDFLYIEDAVNAIIKSLSLQDGRNHIYNIGTGKTISIKELFKLFLKLSKKESKLKAIYKPARRGDIVKSGSSIKKAKQELKFKEALDLANGVTKLMQEEF